MFQYFMMLELKNSIQSLISIHGKVASPLKDNCIKDERARESDGKKFMQTQKKHRQKFNPTIPRAISVNLTFSLYSNDRPEEQDQALRDV